MFKRVLSAFAGLLVLAGVAFAQVAPLPQVQSLGPNDLIQDIVGGAPQAGNQYVSGQNLAGAIGIGYDFNYLIGGKADTNLWQVGTTGSSVTTTLTYGGPDMWAYWSGTNTAMTISKVTTAAALPAGSRNVFRMQRTASQTGVVQMCAANEIASINAAGLQGLTVEADMNVYTGANFSGTGMTAYIVTGTAADEGTVNLAFGLNAGGGGSAGWTGQANATAAVIPLSAVSTAYRVAAVASIPAAALEVAVVICYTPVGTAGTTDALYFDNVELRRKGSLSSFVNTTAGYVLSNSVLSAQVNGTMQYATIPGYAFRQATDEAGLQYASLYVIPEVDTAAAVQGPAGDYDTTTTCSIAFPLPVQMRAVPTLIGTSAIGSYNALSATTFKIAPTATTPVVLATPFAALQTGASTTTSGVVAFKTTAETQFNNCVLNSTAAGAGAFGFSARL